MLVIGAGFLGVLRHAVSGVEPDAEVDKLAALAAERERLVGLPIGKRPFHRLLTDWALSFHSTIIAAIIRTGDAIAPAICTKMSEFFVV